MFRGKKHLWFSVLWLVYFYLYNTDYYLVFSQYVQDKVVFGDVVLSYITAVIWFFTSFGVVGFVIDHWSKILNRTFEERKNVLFVLEHVFKFFSLTKYILAFYIFSYLAVLPPYIKGFANKGYSIIVLVIFLFFLTGFVNRFFQEELIEKSKLKAISKNLLPFVNKVIVIFIWIVWAITIIGNLGYNISALVAWAWIWGLAVAFAAQKSIANIFGAMIILLNKPFKLWDFVNVNGISGTVQDIWLSYLTLADKAWHQVMIPNEAIISTNVENYTVRKNRRVDFNIWLTYWTSGSQMKKWIDIIEGLLEACVADKTVLKFRVNFDSFGDFALNVNATYFSLVGSIEDYLKQKEKINLDIKSAFEKAWIDIAFPTHEVILKKEA
jgi:MscS family membrane protein